MEKLVLPMPARFRVVGWVMLVLVVGGMALIGLLVWKVDAPIALMVLPLMGLALQLWTIPPLVLGNRTTQLDADGVLTRVYPWDRKRTLVPWSEVTAVWVAPIGRYRYLHVVVRDVDRYLVGRRFRRSVLENLTDTHGTPVLVYLPGDEEPALEWCSHQSIPILDGRPTPEIEPAPVPPRVYRAAPRNLVLPLVVLLVAAGVAWLSWAAGLVSLVLIALYLAVFGIFLLVRLRGRTVLDESGFTVGRRHLPWSSIARVRFVTFGALRAVQVNPRLGKPVVALGLVDQPLGDPRYAGRVAEVKAACAGRVDAVPLRQNAVVVSVVVAGLLLFYPAYQFATFDSPWEDKPWWPGVQVATSTPDPCAALSTEDAGRLVPGSDPELAYGDPDSDSRSCRRDGGDLRLDVNFRRESYGDLIAETRDSFRRTTAIRGATEPVPGLGDEAAMKADDEDVVIFVRRGNIVVEVSLNSNTEEAPDRATVLAVTRHAVGLVDLR